MSHTAEKPPRGIWYEAERRRWRVRVYRRNRIVFCNYARSFPAALTMWRAAKEHQNKIRKSPESLVTQGLEAQLHAMVRGLI